MSTDPAGSVVPDEPSLPSDVYDTLTTAYQHVDEIAVAQGIAEVQSRYMRRGDEYGAEDSDITCIGCEGPTNNPDCYCDKCALNDQAEEIDALRAELAAVRVDERQRIADEIRKFAALISAEDGDGPAGYVREVETLVRRGGVR